MALFLLGGSAEAILSADQIRPGMRGYGRTVLSGTRISRFDVTVIDVVASNGATPDLILIRVSGAEIEAAGGISAGMSGSPIYVDDQLIGGIAYTTPYADTTYGYVTPIEFMLPLLDWPEETEDPWEQRADARNRTPTSVARDQAPSPRAGRAGEGCRGGLLGVLARAQSPLMVSGISSRAVARTGGRLALLGLRPVQAPGAGAFDDGQPMQPGSSIGVQLLRGDINVTAVGTMTHVDGGRFVAFGHSFIHQGPAAFPLVATRVAGIIPSAELPFKLASPSTRVAGSVLQDRAIGLGGRLGAAPSMVSLRAEVSGEHIGQPLQVLAQVVRDPELTAELIGMATLGAVDSLIDREGLGSARLTVSAQMPDGTSFSRTDIVDAQTDVGGYVGLEVKEILEALYRNPIGPVEPASVTVQARLSRRPGSARIVSAQALSPQVRPGETCRLRVEVLPFRGAVEQHIVELPIPAQAAPGPARVRVSAKTGDALLAYGPFDSVPAASSIPELLTDLGSRGRRCSLVCDLVRSPFDALLPIPGLQNLVPVQPEDAAGLRELPARTPDTGLADLPQALGLLPPEARVTADTDYALTGDLSVPVRILAP